MIAVGTVVLTGTITPAQAFSGFANSSVLLVVIAFIVAQAVVKSGLGRRISLLMVSRFGGSPLGLAYSLVLTDAAIAPAFPSNTARGGVLFPIVLSVVQGSGLRARRPRGPAARRLPHVLRDGEPRGLLRPLDDGHLCQSDRRADRAEVRGRDRLRQLVPRLLGAGARRDRDVARCSFRSSFRPASARRPKPPPRHARISPRMGPLSRDEWITAVTFVVMVAGWVFGGYAEAQRHQHRVHGVRRAAGGGRAHARRHRQAGRHAGDLPLARGPVRPERPAQRARLHGLRGRAPRLAPGRPVLAGPCTSP